MTVSPFPLSRSELPLREATATELIGVNSDRLRAVAAVVVLSVLILQVSLSIWTALDGKSVARVRSHSAPVTASPGPGKQHC